MADISFGFDQVGVNFEARDSIDGDPNYVGLYLMPFALQGRVNTVLGTAPIAGTIPDPIGIPDPYSF